MADVNDPVAADVLVLGGGVQGLWLLKELRAKGYSAILLEIGLLGGGQSLHSHLYVHSGQVYTSQEGRHVSARIVELLRDTSRDHWVPWLQANAVERACMPSHFGFNNESVYAGMTSHWDGFRLKHHETAVPDALAATLPAQGHINRICTSDEDCLIGESLLHHLCAPLLESTGAIREVAAITMPAMVTVPIQIQVVTSAGEARKIIANAVVLAAGTGNQALLETLKAGAPVLKACITSKQVVRQGHMLIIKGHLPELSGVFPDCGKLFLVSRVDQSETVWLVSDHRSPTAEEEVQGGFRASPRWWFGDAHSGPNHWLGKLAPKYFGTDALRGNYQWGLYPAPKAEQDSVPMVRPDGWCEQIGGTRVWVLWPTKLTLAPHWSQVCLDQLQQQGVLPVAPRPSLSHLGFPQPGMARETWRSTQLLSWAQFVSQLS